MIEPGKIAPGQPVRLNAVFRDAETGQMEDPGTLVFKLRGPCSETAYTYGTDAEVVKDSTGTYHIDVTPNHGGRWFYRWVSTGAGAGAVEGDFNVQRSRFEDCGVPFCWDYR